LKDTLTCLEDTLAFIHNPTAEGAKRFPLEYLENIRSKMTTGIRNLKAARVCFLIEGSVELIIA
jgi:hypothetical protein